MSNLIPFDSQLPAHLRAAAANAAALNAGAANGAGGGVSLNKISIKGGKFRLVVGGDEIKVFEKNAIDLVIVRANDSVTKSFYAKPWKPGQEPEAPDCSSDDGVTPRADSKAKQCDSCAACPKNEWGSYINPQTGGKGKACSDSKRIAVCAPNALKEGKLYQLQIPAASLRDFAGFIGKLNSIQPAVPYNAVLTRISFDTDVTYPKLKFEPVGWLTEEMYANVQRRFDDEDTRNHAGVPGAAAAAAGLKQPEPQVQAQQAPAAQQQAPAEELDGEWGDEPKAQAQTKVEVQQTPAAAEDDGWGDETPAAAQQQAAPAPAQRRPRKPRQEPAPQAPATIDGATGQVDAAGGADADLDDVFGEGWD